jgi:uncharacterized protein YggE
MPEEQSRSPLPVLTVRGEATLEVPPEIVDLAIAITARDPRRERVVDQLAARNRECLALLEGYGEGVQRIATSGIAVYPELRPGGRKEQVRSYLGSVRLAVTVVDFAILGELVGRVAEADMTTLAGPWWKLRPDSPVHRRVRQDAARDAIVRAREYAEAVGAELTGLVELADEGLTAAGGTQARLLAAPMGAGATFRGAPDREQQSIDLEPQVQVVHARVEARFTISQPGRL